MFVCLFVIVFVWNINCIYLDDEAAPVPVSDAAPVPDAAAAAEVSAAAGAGPGAGPGGG